MSLGAKCTQWQKVSPKSLVLTTMRLMLWSQLESVQAVLHIGASNHWDIDQMDVKPAFLHGDLKEELYMEQP
jgi:hypothetical protein